MTPLFSEQIQLDEHVHDRPVGRLIEYCQHFQFIDEFIIPCSRHHARIIKLLIKEIIFCRATSLARLLFSIKLFVFMPLKEGI